MLTLIALVLLPQPARAGSVPTFTWLDSRIGYETDGVEPNEGPTDVSTFVFKVKLTDVDGDEPKYVRLVLRKDGTRWATLDMNPGVVAISSGRGYGIHAELPVGRWAYRFEARDADGRATGTPTALHRGPSVYPPIEQMPDVLVAHGGRWHGNNIYNTSGVYQRAKGAVRAGRVRVYKLRVSNDRSESDRVRITGPAAVGPLSMQYVTANGADVTHKVTADGWAPTLNVGGSTEIRVRVRCDAAATVGERYRLLVRAGRHTWDAQKYAGTADTGRLVVTIDPADTSATCLITSLSANDSAGGVAVTYSLSSPARVRATITNMAGRPVRALPLTGLRGSGRSTLLWNGCTDLGPAAPAGAYLIRLDAVTESGANSSAVTRVTLAPSR